MDCIRSLSPYLVATLLLLLSACSDQPETPEQRIRALIDSMQQLVEAGKVRQLDEFLHADYTDPRHRDRHSALGTLSMLLQRHRGVHLFTFIHSVKVDPKPDGPAEAIVYVAMTGVPVESIDALVSLKADLYRFKLVLAEEADGWQVSRSRWERVDPGNL